uniref:Uncharacterized protein n=1 Tax=Rhizophora mucronata TaxID=61149 RepID=A0A2P2IVX0_RHIMU
MLTGAGRGNNARGDKGGLDLCIFDA